MSDLQLENFENLDVSDLKMPMIVIYNNDTKDYPGMFVARLFDLNSPTNCVVIKPTYEEIYDVIPQHMVKMDRSQIDDPVIKEVWV